ncbi:MAG: MFS transporter [Acidobacteria bacterium]|nr:MAG: MFS transporter [Acidobacteriota bacterium]
MTDLSETSRSPSAAGWLNRNVVGMGLTSLLSDAGHELATALLPGFMHILGLSAAALGAIEGISDAVSSFVKLAGGWLSDRTGRRKPIAVGGYFLTGAAMSLFAFAEGWGLIMAGRLVGWFGRGIRGPARDSLLAESVSPETRGRAFGFHRAGDTIGAIIGPLIGVGLLALLSPHAADPARPFRVAFFWTLLPGLGSAVTFALMVREARRPPSQVKFWASIRSLPAPFMRFLVGVGTFGLGDFSHTLMILAAAQLLTPPHGASAATEIAALLFALHNVFYAGASYPVGALSDRWGRRGLLASGYLLGALTAAGFLAAFLWHLASFAYLALLFILGGTYVAFQDALEGAMTSDLVPVNLLGTAYGLRGTVNGVGDLISSLAVGLLWTAVSPVAAFLYAAVTMLVGSAILWRVR